MPGEHVVLLEKSDRFLFGIADGHVFRVRVGGPADAYDGSAESAARLAAQPGAERYELGQIEKAEIMSDGGRTIILTKHGGGEVRLFCGTEEVQQRFAAAYRSSVPNLTESQGTNRAAGVLGPGFIIAVVGVLGAVAYSIAKEKEAGTYTPSERFGKARIIAKFGAWIADMLGTKGTLVVGGILIATCLAWMAYEVTHPLQVVTLKRR